jgi:hypothetical protein
VAHHFWHARGLVDTEAVVAWMLLAADDARATLAWEHEIAHYTSALQLLDEADSADDATRGRILLKLADRQGMTGGDDDATYRRVVDIATRHGWPEMLAEAATAWAREREYGIVDPDNLEVLERALSAVGEHDSPWRARVLARLADTLAIDGRQPGRRAALSRDAVELARRLDDPRALMTALESRAYAIAAPDTLPERIQLIAEARGIAANEADPFWAFGLGSELVVLNTELGDTRIARAELDALAQTVDRKRLHGTYPEAHVLHLRAAHALIDGRLADAELLAQRARALFTQLDEPDAARLFVAMTLPIRLHEGRAAELLDPVAELAKLSPAHAPWRAALCLLQANAGRVDDASAGLSALVAHDCGSIPRLADWLAAVTMLAHAAAELADTAAAATLDPLLSPYADRLPALFYGSGPIGPVSQALGRIAALRGQTERATALFERTIATSAAIPAPIWIRNAELELARVRVGGSSPRTRRDDAS